MIRNRLIDKTAPIPVDSYSPRLATVEHKMRKNRGRPIRPNSDGRRCPKRSAQVPVADTRTNLKRPILDVTVRSWLNGGPLWICPQRRVAPLGMAVETTSCQDQSTCDANVTRCAIAHQSSASHRSVRIPHDLPE